MTGLVIPYNTDKYPFSDLANWSTVFPFKIEQVTYPSVDHYVFCAMTKHMDDAVILSTLHNSQLRQRYNQLSDEMYRQTTKHTIDNGVHLQFAQNKLFRTFFQTSPQTFYYYINENMLWGINSDGYGFNLLGMAYSRLIDPSHSSYYAITESTIYAIYRTNELLIHHLQEGNDIQNFIGQPLDAVLQRLNPMYPNQQYLDSTTVYHNYIKDPFFHNIQYEIDYPLNLAGFIRKKFANQINFYLRTKFHRIMISKYFGYVLKKRYDKMVDISQTDSYVRQQMSRLTEQKKQDLSDMLYSMYNDPSTSEKTFVFLDRADIESLYETEIQFLTPDEITNASRYVPFLYRVKPDQSLYVYDTYDSTNIDPSTTSIAPFANYVFNTDSYEFTSLGQYIFVELARKMTNMSLGKSFEIMTRADDVITYQEMLSSAVSTYKLLLMRRGMVAKFNRHVQLQYLLYNTTEYGDNIKIEDPDIVFSSNMTKILLNIRKDLKSPYFPISYQLVGNHMDLQDHIRFRLEDFKTTIDAYRRYTNKRKVELEDYKFLQTHLYRDPMKPKRSRPMIPEFFYEFEDRCTKPVIDEMWSFFLTFSSLLTSSDMMIRVKEKDTMTQPKSIASIVSYFVNTFYKGTDDMKFYEFVLTILIGRTIPFTSSIAYYSPTMENEVRQYLKINEFRPEFMVNIFGVIQTTEKHISLVRQRYFSYWALPIQSPPFPSNLAGRLSGIALIGKAIAEIEEDKKMERMRKRRQAKEARAREQQEMAAEEEQEELEVDVEEMLRDLGLEDEEEENMGEDANDYEEEMFDEF